MQSVSDPFISLSDVSKTFPGVRALTNVSLDITRGRGHALVGENGAGKSTLVKIIAGIQQPSTGKVAVDGQQVVFRSPSEARRYGVSLVPQELSLAPDRSVAENILMGQLPRLGPFLRRRAMLSASVEALETLGLDINPAARLGDQPPAVQQLVMIARGIASKCRLFILDEPTAALTAPEIVRLFKVLRDLKQTGAALLYISHRLVELREVVEDITVLRDGAVVDRMSAQDSNEHDLVRAMIGRPIERFFDTHVTAAPGNVRLAVQGLTRAGRFENISFAVRAGEIVGLAGLVGAGRTEVVRAVYGLDSFDSGAIEVDGQPVRVRSPRDAIAAGIVLVPEERKQQGLVLNRSISDNIVLPHLKGLSVRGFFRERRLRAYSERVSLMVGVKAASVLTTVGTLSGGNQQKVVLGRWLTDKPKVYILDEPTRGIDVQAKAEIYAQIGRLANEGAGVLVISSELPEVLGICHRIMVMRSGRLVAEMPANLATEQALLQLAMVDEFLGSPREAAPDPLLVADGPIGDPARSYRVAVLLADAAHLDSLMLEVARHSNLLVDVELAEGDVSLQAERIDANVARGVDAIVLAPAGLAVTPAVERATQAGIPVIGFDGNVASRAYRCWLWPNWTDLVATYETALTEKAGACGVVAEIPGPVGSATALLLHDGFCKIADARPGLKLVAAPATACQAAAGEAAAKQLISSTPAIAAWFVHDPVAAIGVRRLLKGAGRDDVVVVGRGALSPMPAYGDLALRAALRLLAGSTLPSDVLVPASGRELASASEWSGQ